MKRVPLSEVSRSTTYVVHVEMFMYPPYMYMYVGLLVPALPRYMYLQCARVYHVCMYPVIIKQVSKLGTVTAGHMLFHIHFVIDNVSAY